MDNFTVAAETNSILIRFVLAKTSATDIRDGLKGDYTNIPKLDQDTFESFADWLFEDVSDSVLRTLWDIHLSKKQTENNDTSENDASEIEPW